MNFCFDCEKYINDSLEVEDTTEYCKCERPSPMLLGSDIYLMHLVFKQIYDSDIRSVRPEKFLNHIRDLNAAFNTIPEDALRYLDDRMLVYEYKHGITRHIQKYASLFGFDNDVEAFEGILATYQEYFNEWSQSTSPDIIAKYILEQEMPVDWVPAELYGRLARMHLLTLYHFDFHETLEVLYLTYNTESGIDWKALYHDPYCVNCGRTEEQDEDYHCPHVFVKDILNTQGLLIDIPESVTSNVSYNVEYQKTEELPVDDIPF